MREDLLEAVLRATPESSAYAGKTVLVTGASGQIGLNIIGIALARGAQVIGLCHKTSIEFVHPRLTWLHADLTAPGTLGVPSADILIHAAAIWMLPEMLAPLAAAGIKRIVVFGSTSIFGKRDSADAAERAVVERLTTAEDKLSRAAAAQAFHLTILRPTMIYGMGLDANITRMARMIRKFHFVPICYPADGLRQPVQAHDLAEAALAAWDNSATYGKAYNLGGGETIPYRTMVERLFRHLGKKPRLIALPFLAQSLDFLNALFPFIRVNGEVARRMNSDLAFDNGPAAEDFGYRTRGFLAGDVIL
jgi:nucleoside-diphosphate-sugar epimerase